MKNRLIKLISCLIPSKNLRHKLIESSYLFKLRLKNRSSIVENNGIDNKAVIIYPDGHEENVNYIEGLQIQFLGSHNIVQLYAPLPKFINCRIEMMTDAKFILHESQHKLRDLTVWRMRKGTKLEIGKNFSCENCRVALHGEDNLQVSIGEECMFSYGIYLQATDNHSIIDKNSGLPINQGGKITIGNHVWLCPNVRVLKNVSIPDNCVIGTNCILTKSVLESACLIVGTPGRIAKRNITWSRWSAQDYMEKVYNKECLNTINKFKRERERERERDVNLLTELKIRIIQTIKKECYV